jgi:hypothetical protein
MAVRSPQRRARAKIRFTPIHALLITAVCFLGQIATGTNLYTAFLLAVGLLAGLIAVPLAGGFASVSGLLTGILVASFLLIGMVVKILLNQPFDQSLSAPVHTSEMVALGFLGLLIGLLIQRQLPSPKRALIPPIQDARMYLALTITFLVLGYGGYFISVAADLGDETNTHTGGIMGIAHAFSSVRSFTIVPALYFAWARQGKRFMTHPLVLGILIMGSVLGVFATGKQESMEPLLFYVAISFIRYGLRDKRLLALSAAGILYYGLIIYPYSQYVRHNGGRQGNLSSRLDAVRGTFWSMLTDPDFRRYANDKVSRNDTAARFFGTDKLDAFERFAMISQADRLIHDTDVLQAFSGWETITWGLKMCIPSFIYHDKPVFGTGNYLGQITGEVSSGNQSTQISFGVLANFYNAFALPGVFFGSLIFFGIFNYSFRFWFASPRITRLPMGSTIWAVLLIATFHHLIVEESLAGLIIPTLEFPLAVLFLFKVSKFISRFLPSTGDQRLMRTAAGTYGRIIHSLPART